MKKFLFPLFILLSFSSSAQDTIRIKLPVGYTNSAIGNDTLWKISENNIYNNLGNVGIGTTNLNDSNFRLFVETGIRTRKIKVDQSAWPDYVFDENYELLPLKKIAQYIEENKHLPDLPSAYEVEQNGIDLGDNQSMLLKKVEEFTLYLIEQNKETENLEKIVDRQNKKIDEQAKKIAELESLLNKLTIKKGD